MPEPLSWSLIAISILCIFYFSASETALSCCNRFKIQVKADDGSKSAKLVIKVLDKFDRALTTVLVGNNIFAILVSVIATTLFVSKFSAIFDDYIIGLIASISMSLLVYVLGDALPKTIARKIPDTISLISIYPLYILLFVLTYIIPVTLIFEGLVKLIEKIFKVKQQEEFTEEDFEHTLEKVSEEGMIEEEQSEIIQSTLDFVDTQVKEVLTPKEKVFAIDITGLNNEKLKDIITEHRYSRIPVYEKEFDNIIGVLVVKEYAKAVIANPNCNIRRLLRAPYFVKPNVMIDDLFNGFKKNHTHIALVRNAQKDIIGMVTMEDILEEIVEGISEPFAPKKGGNA